jgi:methyl-accepting chemotaxis protein
MYPAAAQMNTANRTQTTSTVAAIKEISAIITTTNEMSRPVNHAATSCVEVAKNMAVEATAVNSSTELMGRMTASVGELTRMATELHDLVADFTY